MLTLNPERRREAPAGRTRPGDFPPGGLGRAFPGFLLVECRCEGWAQAVVGTGPNTLGHAVASSAAGGVARWRPARAWPASMRGAFPSLWWAVVHKVHLPLPSESVEPVTCIPPVAGRGPGSTRCSQTRADVTRAAWTPRLPLRRRLPCCSRLSSRPPSAVGAVTRAEGLAAKGSGGVCPLHTRAADAAPAAAQLGFLRQRGVAQGPGSVGTDASLLVRGFETRDGPGPGSRWLERRPARLGRSAEVCVFKYFY